MASYNLILRSSVEKDFRHLPRPLIQKILQRIEGLKTEPFPYQTIKLSGAERLYRIRVGDYRIVYEVDTATRRVTIHYVRHRREVYRGM
jgi:mRNA interferase RelE/StbE